jgi:cytochrome c oxidase subunit 2
VQAGRDLFQAIACVNCHTVRETLASGTFGPDLSHLMSRVTLGAGVVENTLPNLRAWMQNPQHLKPGNLMPDMKLTPPELEHIVAYLATLK